VEGEFYGQGGACWLEAFFHVSGILVQFACVVAIGVRNAYTTRSLRHVSVSCAGWTVGGIWVVCTGVTALLSLISPIYLMSAGTYCFFEFKSPAILYWLVPGLILAVVVLIVTFAVMIRLALHSTAQTGLMTDASERCRFACSLSGRASVFVAVICVGWVPAAFAAFYEYATSNQASAALVTLVGVCGTLHSVLVPLVYSWTAAGEKLCCCKKKAKPPHDALKHDSQMRIQIAPADSKAPVMPSTPGTPGEYNTTSGPPSPVRRSPPSHRFPPRTPPPRYLSPSSSLPLFKSVNRLSVPASPDLPALLPGAVE
jgi:hypothetical protein